VVAPPVSRQAAPDSRSSQTARPSPLVSATVAILVAATCIPLGYVVWGAASVGWARAYELVVRPRVGELLVNTVALVIVTVPLCVVVGVGLAWLVERTDLPGRTFWRPLFVAPLAIPAFVNSYAWVGVVPSLHGLWAGVLITTLSYFPFMYLPAAATLRRLDPAVEESARALGSDSAGVFFRVVLPQLRLAILGGALLIGVHLLAEFGAFAMVRFDTFTVAIFQQFRSPSTVRRAACSPECSSCCAWHAGCRKRWRAARRGMPASRGCTRPRHVTFGPHWFPCGGLIAMAVLASLPVWTILRGLDRRHRSGDVGEDRQRARPDHRTGGLLAAALTTALAFPVAG
jgi:iron(III) transport system permease protein